MVPYGILWMSKRTGRGPVILGMHTKVSFQLAECLVWLLQNVEDCHITSQLRGASRQCKSNPSGTPCCSQLLHDVQDKDRSSCLLTSDDRHSAFQRQEIMNGPGPVFLGVGSELSCWGGIVTRRPGFRALVHCRNCKASSRCTCRRYKPYPRQRPDLTAKPVHTGSSDRGHAQKVSMSKEQRSFRSVECKIQTQSNIFLLIP